MCTHGIQQSTICNHTQTRWQTNLAIFSSASSARVKHSAIDAISTLRCVLVAV